MYLIGENNKLQFILSAFREYKKIYNVDFKAEWIKDEDIEDLVKQVNNSSKPVTIVLLSDENQDNDSLDANVINNLIYLEGK